MTFIDMPPLPLTATLLTVDKPVSAWVKTHAVPSALEIVDGLYADAPIFQLTDLAVGSIIYVDSLKRLLLLKDGLRHDVQFGIHPLCRYGLGMPRFYFELMVDLQNVVTDGFLADKAKGARKAISAFEKTKPAEVIRPKFRVHDTMLSSTDFWIKKPLPDRGNYAVTVFNAPYLCEKLGIEVRIG